MRTNFFYKFKHADEDDLHSVSIQDMGNYHEYLKNQAQPLREIDPQMVRQHMFGNPFKLVSKEQRSSMFGMDEIDEVFEESAENQLQNNQKIPEVSPKSGKRSGSASGNKRRGSSKGFFYNLTVIYLFLILNRLYLFNVGPLSKRINYLKNLYTSNTSSASSIVSESSDIEILEDTASSFTFATETTTSFVSDVANNSEKPDIIVVNQQTNNDIANLNDFNDVEMQQIEITNQVRYKFHKIRNESGVNCFLISRIVIKAIPGG